MQGGSGIFYCRSGPCPRFGRRVPKCRPQRWIPPFRGRSSHPWALFVSAGESDGTVCPQGNKCLSEAVARSRQFRVLKRGMTPGSSQLKTGIVFIQEHRRLWSRPQRSLEPLPGPGRFRNAEWLSGLGDDFPGWKIEAMNIGHILEPAPLRATQPRGKSRRDR